MTAPDFRAWLDALPKPRHTGRYEVMVLGPGHIVLYDRHNEYEPVYKFMLTPYGASPSFATLGEAWPAVAAILRDWAAACEVEAGRLEGKE